MEITDSLQKIVGMTGFLSMTLGNGIMLVVACVLLYLAVWKKFEPLLLLPIGFGCLLANLPMSHMASTDEGGLLNIFVAERCTGIVRLRRFEPWRSAPDNLACRRRFGRPNCAIG